MIVPKRIQLSRQKGYKKPESAVVVTRQSKHWGNPFNVKEYGQNGAVERFYRWLRGENNLFPEQRKLILDNIDSLEEKDLACFCGLDEPCHADLLLQLANQVLYATVICATNEIGNTLGIKITTKQFFRSMDMVSGLDLAETIRSAERKLVQDYWKQTI